MIYYFKWVLFTFGDKMSVCEPVAVIPKILVVVSRGSSVHFMNKPTMLDLYFGDARSKLIELAAFFDRIEREGAESMSDFRLLALRDGIAEILKDEGPSRTERIQNLWSDMTEEPIPEAHTKAAIGVRPDYASAASGE